MTHDAHSLTALADASGILGLLAVVLFVAWFFGRRPSAPLVFHSADEAARLATDRLRQDVHALAAAREQGPMLARLAAIAHEDFELARVVVRILNPRADLFEARAFAGLDAEQIATASTADVTRADFDEMVTAARAAGSSWWVRCADDAWPDARTDDPDSKDAPAERLVVPLLDARGVVCGTLCGAPGPRVPDAAAIAQLEMLATAAAAGLQATSLRSNLIRRELEYEIVSERLREAQSLRDNFVANVSHELRTPLTSVKAYAETLARGSDTMDAATRRDFAAVIEHEAERLDQVFDDLLDVAHIEGRARSVARDRVDLRAIVRERCASERHQFTAAGLELKVYGPDDPVDMQGDAKGLDQVLDHLLDNARKFTGDGGHVRVTLGADEIRAVLTVEDTGIGVPEQELHRIFERFYQVDGSATRAYGGQGLGLTLCRDIVNWHHGRIRAEVAESGGTRVVVELPRRGLVVRQVPEGAVGDATERVHWESFLQLAMHLVSDLTGTRVSSIMLVDAASATLRVEAAVGLDEEIVQNTMMQRGEGVAGHVWATGETLLVPDLDRDTEFSGLADVVTYGTRSLLSVPLVWNDEVVGVLNVNTRNDGRSFDDDDRLLLEALADRLVVALDHFERYRAGFLRLTAVESGVRAMLEVGRERQTVLRELFARIGLESGRRLGLDDDALRALAYAVRTYDLGLSEVSAGILRKAGPLSPEERARIRDHVHLGTELVAELEPSPAVRKMILHHHENVDGTGYPDGLQGEAIPVGARIVRLVDALGALLHDRPFREAMPIGPALSMVEEGAGSRYCPRITPVFLDVVRDHEAEIESLLAPANETSSVELQLGPPSPAP